MWREYVVPADALYFEANTANSTIKLIKNGSPIEVSLETSTDGATWTDYTIGNTITLTNIGDKVYWRNKSETPTNFSTSGSSYYQFSMTGSIAAHGSINYLLCKNGTDTLLGNYTFYRLFYNLAALVLPPSLPAETLTSYCYYQMFQGCTNLNGIPSLPAETLTSYCCYQMFQGCSKIKLSTIQSGEYQIEYRIPTTGTGIAGSYSLYYMFYLTGGTIGATPSLNVTYYVHKDNTIV